MSVNVATDPAGAKDAADARAAARETRRAFAQSPLSRFVRAMRHAIQQYLDARGQGVSREDACKGLELELREAWPKSVSKFRPDCDACEGTGYVEHVCWDQHRCGREVCAKNPDRQHLYVVACHCAKGDRFRPKAPSVTDELAQVGKVQKKTRGWRQVGR